MIQAQFGVGRGMPLIAMSFLLVCAGARMRDTKEYAERKAEEARRLEHHAKPPEPLEELDL